MTKLIAFGDSIFAGWNGKSQDSNDQRIPELIGQALGWEVNNTAISGAQFDDRDSGFPNMTRIHSAAGYDYAIVNFGVNNWCFPSGGLDYVERKAREGIDNLRLANPSIHILMDLPTEDFRNGSTTLYDVNSQGWSQNMLDNMLVKVANDTKIDYYDWRDDPVITYANANQTLGDGTTGVHPTSETSKLLAQRLVAKFQQMMQEQPNPTPSQPLQDDQPPTPSQDDQPYGKYYVDQLSIDRLDDLFKIGDNVDPGITKTIAKINDLYKVLALIGGRQTPVMVSKQRTSPGNSLGRSLYNYVLQSFIDIQMPINDLVSKFNKLWIRNPKTNAETDMLSLLRVDKLVTDNDYKDTVNYNWFLIENKLNELADYVNELFKGR